MTAGVAAFPLLVYALGACRTVYVGDSGDLLTAISVLGIPHPSGYPLYVLAAKVWSLVFFFLPLPLSVSLFSAACGAAACAVLYRAARESGVDTLPAAAAAWLFAFAPSVWAEANIQRVYALNALFVALALRLGLRWSRESRDRDLVAAAFVCGLGASNHLEMGVVGLAVGVFALISRPAILRRWKLLGTCAGVAILGLLPYVYLPLRARAHPLLDWGHPVTPRSFAAVVLREGFWGRAWIRGPDDFLPILKDYAHSLLTESAWVGAVLAVIAVASARRRGWPVGLPLLVMAANLVVLALHGSRSDLFIWHRYYIPSYLCLALLAAWGWQTLAEMASRPILAVASLLPPLALLVIGWRPNDRSRYRIGEDYSRHLLATLPPGSQLIASDDNILFVLMYLNLGEQVRPDVHLILEGVGGSNLPPLSFNPDVDPVFLTHYPNWKIATLDAIPVGLAFRAWRVGTPVPPASSVPERLDGELDPRVPKDYLTRNLIGNFHQMRAMTFELRDWTAARRELELAAESAPDNDVLFYNLGLIYRRNGLLEDALAAFQRSVQINPREIASLSKPRAAHRAAEVQAEIVQRDQLLAELSRDPALEGLPPGSLQYRTVLARRLGALGKPSWARGVLLATP